jgi:hypothetical protein
MRRIVISLAGFVIVICSVAAAEKDTQAATKTRKKLLAKVSVDFKDEMLKECIAEISRQLEDAQAGSLSATYDTGVSQNQRLTFDAKDKSVADVLDGMLKKNSLGYIVVSKDKDRYDGWLKIKQGSERGYPAGEEPKVKAAPKEPEKTKTPAPEVVVPADGDKAEKAAASKLDLARSLLKDGKNEKAKERFAEIVKLYPKTKAAEDAQKELDKLGK